jgi:hypothetical protein
MSHHTLWHVVTTDLADPKDNKVSIRCDCGEDFPGFIAWQNHVRAVTPRKRKGKR